MMLCQACNLAAQVRGAAKDTRRPAHLCSPPAARLHLLGHLARQATPLLTSHGLQACMSATSNQAALAALPPDMLHQITAQLSLATLGAVSCTCRRLRTLLAANPAAWQAAALREHDSSHPISAATDVRAYLQQQHTVHTNIAARRCQKVPAHKPPAGASEVLASPDLLHHVLRAQADNELQVHSAMTGQLLCIFSVPAAATPQSWDASSSCVLCRFGSAWTRALRDMQARPVEFQGAGFCILDIRSGDCATVMLPECEQLPGRGLQQLLVNWAGHFVAVSSQSGDIWVYTPNGTQVNSIKFAALLAPGWASKWQWVPPGKVGSNTNSESHGSRIQALRLWQPAEDNPISLQTQTTAHMEKVYWSPCSSALLVCTAASEVFMFSGTSGRLLAPPQDLLIDIASGAWGIKGLALCGMTQDLEPQLELQCHLVQSHVLVLSHIISGCCMHPVFSPDGEHFAVDDWLVPGGFYVVSMKDGVKHVWPERSHVHSWPRAAIIACKDQRAEELMPSHFLCFG